MKSTGRAHTKRLSQQDRLDVVFSALSDRTRRALLQRLARGGRSLTITELAAPFEMSLPAVSKHIRLLEQAGLIVRDVQGRVHHCSFEAAPLANVDTWLSHYRAFWSETLDALAEFVEKDPR